jgi:hypothetical protein
MLEDAQGWYYEAIAELRRRHLVGEASRSCFESEGGSELTTRRADLRLSTASDFSNGTVRILSFVQTARGSYV